MDFDDVIGQSHLIKHLNNSYLNNRIPHAQLFVGENGYGTLALALACANLLLNSSPIKQRYSSVLQHPDFHFAIPVNTTKTSSKKPTSEDFATSWLNNVKKNPYMDLNSWYTEIGIEKKKGIMSVNEANRISKKLALKSHSGIGKVMLIWCAEKLNLQASNKLLKIVEEPPPNTFLILTTNQEELILDTIKSRCQTLHVKKLSQEAIAKSLSQKLGFSKSEAQFIAQQSDGDYSRALSLANKNTEDAEFEQWFITWVRLAFQAKSNATVVQKLVDWGNLISDNTRDKQVRFLKYCLHFFRQALLNNYNVQQLVYLKPKTSFSLDKFSPYIHGNNISDIYDTLQDAIEQVNRNVNAKLIFTDISFKLTRFIHRKT